MLLGQWKGKKLFSFVLVFITLQKVQSFSILNQFIPLDLATFQLFLSIPTSHSTCCKQIVVERSSLWLLSLLHPTCNNSTWILILSPDWSFFNYKIFEKNPNLHHKASTLNQESATIKTRSCLKTNCVCAPTLKTLNSPKICTL
jgi:hypothetical protein